MHKLILAIPSKISLDILAKGSLDELADFIESSTALRNIAYTVQGSPDHKDLRQRKIDHIYII